MRRQPWRPRSPWLGARTGARRRGVMQGEGGPVLEQSPVEVGADRLDERAFTGDDTLVAEAVADAVMQTPVPARIDISGLLAISTLEHRERALTSDAATPERYWPETGGRDDEESYVARYSA